MSSEDTTDDEPALRCRHLLGIDHVSAGDILTLLARAEYYAQALEDPGYSSALLTGRVIMTLFFENSTRTRTSFDLAAKRLGADAVHWNAATSSQAKGESFKDTVGTLGAMRPDLIVVRHSEDFAPVRVSEMVSCPVVNAGDGKREHPTQALLDALTIRRHFGRIEGLNIAICGDVSHSRVAGSNFHLLTKLGAKLRVIAPPGFMPASFAVDGVETFSSMEDGLAGVDAVMMLRVQKERISDDTIPDDGAYFTRYGLTRERLALANPGAIVLHPGPLNRGIEIDGAIADDPECSVILRQVQNGVPVRMAVLDLLLNRRQS